MLQRALSSGGSLTLLALCLLSGSVRGADEPTPAALRAAIDKTGDERGARLTWQVGTPIAGLRAAWSASDVERGTVSYFADRGFRVAPRSGASWSFGLDLVGVGRGERRAPLPPAHVVADGTRVEYRRGETVEWCVQGPRGLAHGFALAERPAGSGPAVLALRSHGGWSAEILAGGRDAVFVDAAGRRVGYSGLLAWDANDRALDARMVATADGIEIEVDDEGATYPLFIDPVCASEEAKLLASDGAATWELGGSVAIDGDLAVVGAPNLGGSRTVPGFAYVYSYDGTSWNEVARLVGSTTTVGDGFGTSVAVSADAGNETIVVGAPDYSWTAGGAAQGGAWVFTQAGSVWVEQARLEAPDGASFDGFGSSVAVDGNWVVVGASLDDHAAGADAGSAYTFSRTGALWTAGDKLVAGDAAASDQFGEAVAMDGASALIGSALDDRVAGSNAGSAYVFTRSGTTWSEQAKLESAFSGANDNFGSSVAIEGDRAVIGAFLGDGVVTNTGTAYVFDRSGTVWTESAVLSASDGVGNEGFGTSVAVEGDIAVVGAPDAAKGCCPGETGAIYVFQGVGTTWTEETKFQNGTVGSGAAGRLGAAMQMSGGRVLVGAPNDVDGLGAETGAAYTIEITTSTIVSYCTAGTTWNGCNATMSGVGVPSASAPNGFDLVVSNVEGNRNGIIFYGVNGPVFFTWGGGSSWLCVGSPVQRTGGQNSGGQQPLCNGTFTLDWNDWITTHPTSFGAPYSPGQQIWAQAWFRDPPSPKTTSLSDALEFTLCP